MTDGNKIKVTYYRFRNRLKDKVAGLIPAGEKLTIPQEALDAAQAEFDKMSEDYPDYVEGLIKDMVDLINLAIAGEKEERRDSFNHINVIAHDMKGQGGTFGYPLITQYADSLWNFTGEDAPLTDQAVDLVKAHVDTMRVVIRDRIRGNGGGVGKDLSISLDMAVEKYKNRDTNEMM